MATSRAHSLWPTRRCDEASSPQHMMPVLRLQDKGVDTSLRPKKHRRALGRFGVSGGDLIFAVCWCPRCNRDRWQVRQLCLQALGRHGQEGLLA